MGDIARIFTRLVTNFGDSKIADDRQSRLLMVEWESALGHFAPATLNEAVSLCIKTCTFWPTIAEVLKAATALRRDLRSEYERVAGVGSYRAEPVDFCSEGRTEAEEIAKRIADIKRIRHEVGFDGSTDGEVIGAAPERSPTVFDVSTSDLSAVTRDSCVGRGARGLPTCGAKCPARDCALRRTACDDGAER